MTNLTNFSSSSTNQFLIVINQPIFRLHQLNNFLFSIFHHQFFFLINLFHFHQPTTSVFHFPQPTNFSLSSTIIQPEIVLDIKNYPTPNCHHHLRRVINVDIPDVDLAKGIAQSQDSFSGIQGESHVPNVAPFVVERVNFRSFRVTRRRDL